MMTRHFEEKNPLQHVLEKRIEGQLSVSESHGMEMPGHLSAAADAARDSSLSLILLWLLLHTLQISFNLSLILLISFGLGLFVWKTGRSAWLGWKRLERLHRVIEQEKYEIEHHRPQEREELLALYGSKGFEGKLLQEVVDVLMADQDRLLKVMLEEEMGLTLQAYEHPLKQSLGAGIGVILSLFFSLLFFFFFPPYGILIAPILVLSTSAILSSIYEKNRIVPAIIWNLSIGALAFGVSYYLLQMFQ